MDQIGTFEALLYVVPLIVFALVVFEMVSVTTMTRIILVAVCFSVLTLVYLWFDVFQCCTEASESTKTGYIGDKIRLLIDSLIILALYLYIYKVIKFDVE